LEKIDLSASVIKEDNVKVSHIGGTCFVKTWRVRNDGNSVWPANSRIELKKGDPLFATSSSFVFATKEIAIGEEIDISIPLKAPMQPGKYVAVWKLTVDNQGTWSKHFGHSLKIKIYVQDANGNLVYNKKEYKRKDKKKDYKKKKDKPTWGQYLQQFDQLGFTNKKTNILLLKKTHGDFNQALAILQSGHLANNNNTNNNNNNNNSNIGIYPTLVGTTPVTSFPFAGNNSYSNNNNNNSV